MITYEPPPLLLLAMALLVLPIRCAPAQDAVADFLRCYQNQPTPEELCGRLETVLERHRGTHVEDDILLALADAHIGTGRPHQAVPILERLVKDKQASKIDMVDFWVGWRTGDMIGVRKLYEKSPDFTADHALLSLAHLHLKRENPEKSWQTFEELRGKYPQGDRVQEDLLLMAEFRETHPQLPERLVAFRLKHVPAAAPGTVQTYRVEGPDGDAPVLSELFLRRRRPHLTGLREQAALCHKMGRSSEERVGILKDIVSIYDPLLTQEELTDYCRQGLAEIESLQAKPEGETLEELNDARKIFTQALEKLVEEKRGPSGKDPDETEAKD